MSKTYEFLKECGTFFLATIDKNVPALRPFGAVMEFEKELYFSTAKTKAVYFEEAEIPCSKPRTQEACLALMKVDIEKYPSFIISVVNGGYLKEEITSLCEFAVHLSAPAELRMDRIKKRGYKQFGDRICEGGDMYKQELQFQQFAASRSAQPLKQWKKSISFPVIEIDGAEDYKENAVKIAFHYKNLF